MTRHSFVACLVVSVAASLGSARAGTVSGLFGTGVDANGNLLGSGAADPHYSVSGGSAYTLTYSPIVNAWADNTSMSQWVSTNPTGDPGVGTFDYTTTFTVTGNPALTSISGMVAADDGTMVFLNGTLIFDDSYTGSNSPWAALAPFSATTAFVSGTNTLEFVTPNSSSAGGLQVILTASVPEPGSITMLLLGMAALGFKGFRRVVASA